MRDQQSEVNRTLKEYRNSSSKGKAAPCTEDEYSRKSPLPRAESRSPWQGHSVAHQQKRSLCGPRAIFTEAAKKSEFGAKRQ